MIINNFKGIENKLELMDIFMTIYQLSDDCVYELDKERDIDEIKQIIDLKVMRIYKELEVYNHKIKGGKWNE